MLERVREVQEEGGPAGEQVRKVTALLLRTLDQAPVVKPFEAGVAHGRGFQGQPKSPLAFDPEGYPSL